MEKKRNQNDVVERTAENGKRIVHIIERDDIQVRIWRQDFDNGRPWYSVSVAQLVRFVDPAEIPTPINWFGQMDIPTLIELLDLARGWMYVKEHSRRPLCEIIVPEAD